MNLINYQKLTLSFLSEVN